MVSITLNGMAHFLIMFSPHDDMKNQAWIRLIACNTHTVLNGSSGRGRKWLVVIIESCPDGGLGLITEPPCSPAVLRLPCAPLPPAPAAWPATCCCTAARDARLQASISCHRAPPSSTGQEQNESWRNRPGLGSRTSKV